MTESGNIFQVRQTLNVNGKTRTVEFTIDRGGPEADGGTQSIVLQVTEAGKRTLSVRVERELVTDPNGRASYKLTIDVDRDDRVAKTKLTAEIESRDRDFSWFSVQDSYIVIKLSQKSIESLVAEFTRDMLEFLSSNIRVKEE